MKRARILFTERYNCQKNKRSQSLFAHVFLHHLPPTRRYSSYPVFRGFSSRPPLCPVTSPVPFGVLVSPFIFSLSLSLSLATSPHLHTIIASFSRCLFPAFLSPSHRLPTTVATPWKSSLESRVNEFAITIFHVDVTTYSLVDFRKTRSVLVAYV